MPPKWPRMAPRNSNGPPGEAALSESERLEHTTSIALWDVPSPLTLHQRSNVKVGVKCADGCCLAGAEVAILDETGARVATASLRSVPWDGTKALYWTEIDLPGVAAEGAHIWSAEFAPQELPAPEHNIVHTRSSFRFSFQAVGPPEHCVTIRIVEEQTQNPVEDAELRLGMYRARTDRAGIAMFEVPAGSFELSFWKAGFENAARPVEVTGDLKIDVALSKAPAVEEPYWM